MQISRVVNALVVQKVECLHHHKALVVQMTKKMIKTASVYATPDVAVKSSVLSSVTRPVTGTG